MAAVRWQISCKSRSKIRREFKILVEAVLPQNYDEMASIGINGGAIIADSEGYTLRKGFLCEQKRRGENSTSCAVLKEILNVWGRKRPQKWMLLVLELTNKSFTENGEAMSERAGSADIVALSENRSNVACIAESQVEPQADMSVTEAGQL